MTRVETLKGIAGQGTLDERCANLARYFEAVYFGPPPASPAPKPQRRRRPFSLRQRGVVIRRTRGVCGWWERCAGCRHYLAGDGTCRTCNSTQPNKETA